jgi:hypothetical protein
MERNKSKLYIFIIVLALSILACTVYDIAGVLGENSCDIIGGLWYYGPTFEDYCGPPPDNPQPNSQPVDDVQDEGGGQKSEEQPANEQQPLEMDPETQGEAEENSTTGDGDLSFEECNAIDEFTLEVGEAQTENFDWGENCIFHMITTNHSERGVNLYYSRVQIDQDGVQSDWLHWYYDPGEQLEWPVINQYSYSGETADQIRYWDKIAAYYTDKGCRWIGADESNFGQIAVWVEERPCPVP